MNRNENEIVIKFNMDAKEYEQWKNGKMFYDNHHHKVLSAPFRKLIKFASSITSFQHIKNKHREVEIKFTEKSLSILLSEALPFSL